MSYGDAGTISAARRLLRHVGRDGRAALRRLSPRRDPEEMLRRGGQPSAPSNAPPHTAIAPPPGVKTGTQPETFRRALQAFAEKRPSSRLSAGTLRFQPAPQPTDVEVSRPVASCACCGGVG